MSAAKALWKAADALVPLAVLSLVWRFGLHWTTILMAATYAVALVFVLGWAWGESQRAGEAG